MGTIVNFSVYHLYISSLLFSLLVTFYCIIITVKKKLKKNGGIRFFFFKKICKYLLKLESTFKSSDICHIMLGGEKKEVAETWTHLMR